MTTRRRARKNEGGVAAAAPPGARVRRCPTCGNDFLDWSAGKRGRPPTHDEESCREFSAAMSTLRKWLGPVAAKSTPGAWAKHRGELWAWANAAPAFQKEMSRRSAERRKAALSLPETRAETSARRTGSKSYAVTVGTAQVTPTPFSKEAEAVAYAKVFSKAHLGMDVDVRLAVSGDRVARLRDGKRVYANTGRRR